MRYSGAFLVALTIAPLIALAAEPRSAPQYTGSTDKCVIEKAGIEKGKLKTDVDDKSAAVKACQDKRKKGECQGTLEQKNAAKCCGTVAFTSIGGTKCKAVSRCDQAALNECFRSSTLQDIADTAIESLDLSTPEGQNQFSSALREFGIPAADAATIIRQPNKEENARELLRAFASGDQAKIEAAATVAGVTVNSETLRDIVAMQPDERTDRLSSLYDDKQAATVDALIRRDLTFSEDDDISAARRATPAENRDMLLRARQALEEKGIDPNCLVSKNNDPCQGQALRTVINAALKGLEEKGLKHPYMDEYKVIATMLREQGSLGNFTQSYTGCQGMLQLCGGTVDGTFGPGLRNFTGNDHLANIIAGTAILNEKFFRWVPQENASEQDITNGLQAYNGINCGGCGGDNGFGTKAYYDAVVMKNAVDAAGGDRDALAQNLLNLGYRTNRSLSNRLNIASALTAEPIGVEIASAAPYPVRDVTTTNIPFNADRSMDRNELPANMRSPFAAFSPYASQPTSIPAPVGAAPPPSGGAIPGAGSSPAPSATGPALTPVQQQIAQLTSQIQQAFFGTSPLPAPTPVLPVASILVQPSQVTRGNPVVVSWSSVGMSGSAPCQVLLNAGSGTSTVGQGNEGSHSTPTRAAGTLRFTLQCTSLSGNSVLQTASVSVK